MATLQTNEKKAAEAHAHVRAIALLLEDEQAFAAALEAEVVATVLQLTLSTASSNAPPPPPSRGDTVVVAMLHAQVCGAQNIRSLVSIVLDPSAGYARWRDQVLLTLKRYDLADHGLSDAPPVNDPAWERMENVVVS
jgi:hypothetical protein